MKKNLINAALLGLLVVAAPACTFVSCKDYDDDFNKVNNRLDGLEAAKTQINSEITSLKSSLEAANKKASELEASLSNYATKTELQNGLANKADKSALEAAVANLDKAVADIARLQTRIAALETAKTELEALVKTKVSQEDYDKKVLEIDGRLAAAESGVNLNKKALATLDGKLATLTAQVANQQTVLEKYGKAIEDLKLADETAAKELQKYKDAVKAELDGLKDRVKKLEDAGFQTKKDVDEAIAKASDELTAKFNSALDMLRLESVTSLQLRPAAIQAGIETIENNAYLYNALTLDKADENGVAVFTAEAMAAGQKSKAVYAEASYNVNPSTAKVNTDVANFAFTALRTKVRATASDEVQVTGASYKDGVVTVSFKHDLPANEASEINMIALAYTDAKEGDKSARVVTSDYAYLADDVYQNLRIAAVDGTINTPLDVAPDQYSVAARDEFAVAHDGSALKLAEHVNSVESELANTAPYYDLDENAASESILKKAGFHYEYALVKANKDDKSTEAFEINKTTGELKAKYDEKNPYANVSKEATVRVTLVNANGEVASVGYFTAKVTLAAKVVADSKTDVELKYNCDKTTPVGDLKFSLQPLNQYLAENYKAEWTVWKNNRHYGFTINTAKQFKVENGVATPVAGAKGTISVNYDAGEYGELTLSGLKREDVNISKDGQTYSTIVEVVKNTDPNQKFYIRLTWAPKSVQQAPTVNFTGKKKEQGWKDGAIHVHADLVADIVNGKHQYIRQDVSALFYGDLVSKVDATAYPAFGETSKWVFVNPRVKEAEGTNGKTYTLSASEDGTSFVATEKGTTHKYVIATISNTGLVKFAESAVAADNEVAKALLNKYSAKQLADGQTLTIRVAYKTYDSCDKEIVTNGEHEFDVKFIRPLNTLDTKLIKTFTDANALVQHSGPQDLHKAAFLTDWRDFTPGQQANQEQLFNTYDVTLLVAPKDQWKTNFSGEFKTFKEINATENFDLDFVAASGVGAIAAPTVEPSGFFKYVVDKDHWIAQYTYTTKTANVKEFTILVPIVVQYKWGELATTFQFNVKPTINQPARRK